MIYLKLYLRGALIIMFTAAQVHTITGRHWVGAFVNGSLISLIWWYNVRHSIKVDGHAAAICYALGAGTGTIAGMWLMSWLYGP